MPQYCGGLYSDSSVDHRPLRRRRSYSIRFLPSPQELERLARVHGLPVSPGSGGWSPHTDDSGVESAPEPAPEPRAQPAPPPAVPQPAPVSMERETNERWFISTCHKYTI